MTKNTRFVLIDMLAKRATAFDKNVPLASFEFTEIPFEAEDIESIRTQEYKDLA